jgi:NADPH:quinone reductase-like Zn-dependent oxidoreductase
MKAWRIHGFGLPGDGGLSLDEIPDPDPPGPGQALVRIHAVSLNYRDLLMAQGLYNPRQKLPLVPCSDGAGEVIATGGGVTRVQPGDRVCAAFAQGWRGGRLTSEKVAMTTLGGPLDGMLREYAVFDAEGLVRIPDHLDYRQASALPCAAVTAWNAIVEQGQVKAGDTVVAQGTGGVSLFAMQFARMHGARVIVLSSSDAKLEAAGAGADGVNYTATPDWDKRVRDMTGGVGADHLIEVGGAGTLARSLKAVRMGGTISVIGQLTGNATELNLIPVLMRNIRLQGVLVGSREMFESMNQAISWNRLTPVLDAKVFDMHETLKALEHLRTARHVGKITIQVNALE